MLIHVNLHGRLGHVFGRHFVFDVEKPVDAVRALCVMKKGFIKYMVDWDKRGVGYKVVIDSRPVKFIEELYLSVKQSIDIYPRMVGAKNGGALETIIGAVLVVAAVTVLTGGLGSGATVAGLFGATSTTALGQIALTAGMMGLSMVFGGIAQMIGNPKSNATSRSYILNGAIATSQQGIPVPVGYGSLFVGPIIINAGEDNFPINYSNGQLGGSIDGIIVTDPGTGTPIDVYAPPS
jgi:predicted phage tail protein